MHEVPISATVAFSHRSFERFAEFITGELGIKMCEAKAPMLQSRLMRRLRQLGLDSLDDYQEYLFHSPDAGEERVHFIDAVTTNKTEFFREAKHFEYLARTVLPVWEPMARAEGGLRLWCAGCSSGEEPYTLAMVMAEYAREHPGFEFSIVATDISSKVLEQAHSGIYEESRILPVPDALRHRYLLRSNDPTRRLVRVIPELRRRITFHRLNFMAQDYGFALPFDVIFFRNVMIYFSKPTQEAVILRQCRHLRPGGYMFIGHSESLAGLRVPLTLQAPSVYLNNL
jgi:chemotaxis protein methyltransferase CheR